MQQFPFATSLESQQMLSNITTAIMRFGDRSESEAVRMVTEYWRNSTDILIDDPLLFHECAYYYAMCILHHPTIGDGIERWEKDQRYWPPPANWANVCDGPTPID